MLPRPATSPAALQDPHDGERQLPTDADLLRAIDDGLPQARCRMERAALDGERRDAVAYIKTFSSFFATQASTSCR